MQKRRRALVGLALTAGLVLPASPANVAAEPSEPTLWIKTSDDSVVRADVMQALAAEAAKDQFQAVSSGDGFYAFSHNIAEYTLRLVTSGEGDIESYRDELQQTANAISSQTNIIMSVAPGTVAGPVNPSYLMAPDGEIWVMIASSSGCGTLSGGALGCGGTNGYRSINGELRLSAGVVWLNPTLPSKCHQSVVNHEVGHALGLSHFDAPYLGQIQVMKSTTNCSFSAYRAGDLNGLRWLAETAPSNDNVGAADGVCPLKDTTMSANTWLATKEASEPAHAGAGPRRSVWFIYTASQAGSTTIRTTNDSTDDFNTVLAVYSGAMFAGAVPVASNDDFTGTLSQVTFAAVIGTTYWIAVDGNGTARGETDVVFDLPTTIPPPVVTNGTPTRFLDTRRPGGQTFDCGDQAVGRLVAGTTYQLPVTNRAFVTPAATSVVMNVTIVGPDASGYLTVFPCGSLQPNASSLNFIAGDVIPNLVIAKVGTGGKVCLFTSATTDLLVDVSSFFGAGPALTALTPARLLDTRVGGATVDSPAHAGVGRIAAGTTYELPIVNRGGVSASASTVVLNVTAVNPSTDGYVTVFPCGTAQPNTSNLNFGASEVIPNFVISKVGTGGGAGKVCFFASTATDLIVDVNGYFLSAAAPPSLAPLPAPVRLLDTRNPGSPTIDLAHQGVGRLAAGGTYELPVLRGGVSASATSVVLNVTAVSPSTGGYLTIYPCGSPQPNASNLNFAAGDVIPNSVIAKVGTGGNVCIFSSAAIDLLVDASGYFI